MQKDANVNILDLKEVLWLITRLGDTLYRVKFIIAEWLAVDSIIGTDFINRHLEGIMCR